MPATKSIVLILLLSILAACAGAGQNRSSPAAERQAGLVDLGNGVCRQSNNGLLWQIDKSPRYSTWQEAREYAERLNLGGYGDWRLPTRKELYMLHYLAALGDNDCMMKLGNNYNYWSVSPSQEVNAGRWESYPLCGGNEFKYVKAKQGFVRAVRP
ncbi:MAG: DUF1566 domain-containing protein [Desulfurivibrio sp.]|jgi:formylglycine-generating enzyme required for sulfatase activity|nr:MAG: DUF1566 domain-containing protein [Desulfurivibrio sp.]